MFATYMKSGWVYYSQDDPTFAEFNYLPQGVVVLERRLSDSLVRIIETGERALVNNLALETISLEKVWN